MKELKLSRQTYALGRNGVIKCKGLSAQVVENNIEITPITSYNKAGRCIIAFPVEDILKVADFIREAKNKLSREEIQLIRSGEIIEAIIACQKRCEISMWHASSKIWEYMEEGCLFPKTEYFEIPPKLNEIEKFLLDQDLMIPSIRWYRRRTGVSLRGSKDKADEYRLQQKDVYGWVIYNKRNNLFWSNVHGWVDKGSATDFTFGQKHNLNFPLEGEWIHKTDYRYTEWEDEN